MTDKPLKSDKLHYKIQYDANRGTRLYGNYFWSVRGGNFTDYGWGWARSEKSAHKHIQKVLKKQQSKPSVYTVEEGEL